MLAIGACGIGAVVLGLMIYFATRGTEPAPKPPQSEIRLPPARRLQAIDETTLPAPFPQEQLRATPPDTRRFSPGMLDYEEPFEPPRRSRLPEYRTFRNWDDDFGEASPFGKYPAERFHSHRALVDDALARAYQDEELERKRTAQLEEKRRIEIKHQAAADLSQGKSLASETRGRHAEAIPFLESALQADPLLAEAHRYLGLCYTKTGDAKKGAFHYEEFLHQRPADPHAPAIRQILRSYFGKTGEKPRWPIPND
jgi:tetratricopeptide (TPR) repeat protein